MKKKKKSLFTILCSVLYAPSKGQVRNCLVWDLGLIGLQPGAAIATYVSDRICIQPCH